MKYKGWYICKILILPIIFCLVFFPPDVFDQLRSFLVDSLLIAESACCYDSSYDSVRLSYRDILSCLDSSFTLEFD